MGLTCVFTTKTIIIMQEENEETFVCILIYFPYSTVFHRVEHFGLLFFRTCYQAEIFIQNNIILS